MDVFRAIMERRSVRKFKHQGLTDDVVERLKDALIWAPSAGNLQSRKFYFVWDSELKKDLAKAALNQTFIASAPLVVVGCTDSSIFSRYGDRGVHLYSIQDVSASIMNMMLLAVGEGLGTVWVGAFMESEVIKALSLPGNLRPVSIVPVGYPERIPSAPPRVSRDEAVIEI